MPSRFIKIVRWNVLLRALNVIDSNQQNKSPVSWRDAALALAIAAVLALVYALLIQASYTWDGAFLTKNALKPNEYFYATHLIFGPWLKLTMSVGAGLKLDPRVAGSVQSALTMAGTMALLFIAMRRCGVARGWAALFTLLVALNAPSLENATTVELYGLAMIAVMLSLHAFLSEARRPGRGGAWWLIAANIFVVWVQVGFAFWVLSQYVALAIHERNARRAVFRFAQGFCVLAGMLGGVWASRAIGLKEYGAYDYMVSTFYQTQSLGSHALNFVLAPATWFQAFAGLAVFPAITGWLIERRRLSALAIHAALASILFFGFYHAWNVDWATFYMPLIVVWAIFAALGAQAALRSPDKRIHWTLAVMALTAAIFLIRPYQGRLVGLHWLYADPSFTLSGILFYAFALAQWRIAKRLSDVSDSQPIHPRVALAIGAAALAITLYAYLPRQLWLLQNDDGSEYVAAVRELLDGRDVSRERLITTFHPDRIEIETGLQACSWKMIGSRPSDGMLYDQNPISEWIRDTGRPTDPLRVWIDAAVVPNAETYWNRGILEDIPIDLLSFRPVTIGKFTFMEIAFKDPSEARRHGLRLDAYPEENWAGQPVAWTRPNHEAKVARQGEWLEVEYYIGHKSIGPGRPVRVDISINDWLAHSSRHVANGGSVAKVRVPESAGKQFRLGIKVSPGHRAAEGRDLGIGLYPLRWSQSLNN